MKKGAKRTDVGVWGEWKQQTWISPDDITSTILSTPEGELLKGLLGGKKRRERDRGQDLILRGVVKSGFFTTSPHRQSHRIRAFGRKKNQLERKKGVLRREENTY